ncbi:hypothetical protein Mapa_007477 [Marchantia paleacea]|nr:hypothetical protein Mapa_007477 [Marchantia paleacea]
MDPVRLLCPKLISVTSRRFAKLAGIFPVSSLSCNHNSCKFCRSPSSSGMSPSNLFSFRSKCRSWVRLPRALGIFPIRALWSRYRYCKFGHCLTISSVKLPVNEFWTRSLGRPLRLSQVEDLDSELVPRFRFFTTVKFLSGSRGPENLLLERSSLVSKLMLVKDSGSSPSNILLRMTMDIALDSLPRSAGSLPVKLLLLIYNLTKLLAEKMSSGNFPVNKLPSAKRYVNADHEVDLTLTKFPVKKLVPTLSMKSLDIFASPTGRGPCSALFPK